MSEVDNLWADCVLAAVMYGVHLRFTEGAGDWGVVLGAV
jgi:hypothetical protein